MVRADGPKYSIFDAFGETYVYLQKIFVTEVFVDHFINFNVIYAWEKSWKSSQWAHFLGGTHTV